MASLKDHLWQYGIDVVGIEHASRPPSSNVVVLHLRLDTTELDLHVSAVAQAANQADLDAALEAMPPGLRRLAELRLQELYEGGAQ